MKYGILNSIGNTPMIEINIDGYQFIAKMECMNPFGSMKDRAAFAVLQKSLDTKAINYDTTIVESSSGNFAIALSGVCASMNMKCTCVVDNNITKTNQQIIEQYGSKIVKINTPGKDQSNQEKRIETVKQILKSNDNMYWTNQYDNSIIQESYFSLAKEILVQCPHVEQIFIPVSTCGTIAGVSTWIKEHKSNVKIIAVDSYGSKIFGNRITRNRFTGMGSIIKPGNLKNALIDKVIRVTDYECILNCHSLLKQGLFVGASSGAVVAAIKKSKSCCENIITIFPDRGDRYLNNLYCQEWIDKNISELLKEEAIIS